MLLIRLGFGNERQALLWSSSPLSPYSSSPYSLPLDSFAVSSSTDDCNVINLALTLLWHYGIKIQEETGQEDKILDEKLLRLETAFLSFSCTAPSAVGAGAVPPQPQARHTSKKPAIPRSQAEWRETWEVHGKLFSSAALICPADIFPLACKHGRKHMNV